MFSGTSREPPKSFWRGGLQELYCTAGSTTCTYLDTVLKITLAALKGHIPGTYQGAQHHPDGPEVTQR
jgi:hypothetical protein